MNSLELALLPDWRYCKINYATKAPLYANWQNSPFLLESVPAAGNIGVLTGELSNGLLAVDFDGYFAWDYWNENVPYPIEEINTVSWSSGREARCQMAFTIPKEMWPFVKTFKIVEPNVTDRKPDGLEFRWNGVQSVLPPSMHPDTKKPYYWVVSPGEVYVQELPLEILEWMITYAPPIIVNDVEIEEVTIDNLSVSQLDECEAVLTKIRQHEPRLSYDDWIRVTWATVSHVGTEAGLILMRSLWPEQTTGEYKRLLHGFNLQKSPKFGSLIHRAAKHNTKQTTRKEMKTLDKAFKNNINKLYEE